MGFFKSLIEEAGRKTGGAIGNKLFPKSTDYIRLGELGDAREKRLKEESRAQRRKLEMDHQLTLQEALLELQFDQRDLEHNLSVLTRIAAILDSLPGKWERSELEQTTFKMAKSLMVSGIAICKGIDPNNKMVKRFEKNNKRFIV